MKKFLFLGNGSYNNHGCEAIVRGTMEILRSAYAGRVVAYNGVSEGSPVVEHQEQTSPVPDVTSFSTKALPSTLEEFRNKVVRRLSAEVRSAQTTIAPHLNDSSAMLALGGDNFSLEYGVPYLFLGWNAIARDAGLPVYIWGSSIGPFSSNPRFERQFVRHARTLAGIFVRESESLAYLTRLGLGDKLTLAADPAFAMIPEKPREATESLEDSVGINLSPLMAHFVTAGNMSAWKSMAVQLILSVAKATGRPIALVPHVNATDATRSCDPGWYLKDDHRFLAELQNDPQLSHVPLTLLSHKLSAPELKYEISRLWAFAGARTHATIAAFGSGVPCISLAYSVKARGLNKDIFDTTDFCLSPAQLSPKRLVDAFSELESARSSIMRCYESAIPKLKSSAYAAGQVLKNSTEAYHGRH